MTHRRCGAARAQVSACPKAGALFTLDHVDVGENAAARCRPAIRKKRDHATAEIFVCLYRGSLIAQSIGETRTTVSNLPAIATWTPYLAVWVLSTPHARERCARDLCRAALFFNDLPAISRRRESGSHNDVLTEETRGKRPRYYLRNFHFQTGGWMTDDSASRYDTQVEVLFNGTANATRRQVLPQLHEVFAARDQRKLSLLDIGGGTGRFLDSLKQAWPRLPALGLDMSEPYVRYATRHLKRWARINLTVGNAESLKPSSRQSVQGVGRAR